MAGPVDDAHSDGASELSFENIEKVEARGSEEWCNAQSRIRRKKWKTGRVDQQELFGTGRLYSVYKGRLEDAQGVMHEAAVKLPIVNDKCTSRRRVDRMAAERLAVKHEISVYRILGAEHPHIVRCFGACYDRASWPTKRRHRIVVEGEPCFVVVEYLPTSLQQLLRSGRIATYRDLVTILVDVAKGLQFLHKRKIVHCNLHPSNVLIDDRGTAKLADFRPLGFVAHKGVEDSQRANRMFKYRAPDLVPQKCAFLRKLKAKPSADMYSFGAITKECLTYNVDVAGVPPCLCRLAEECCNVGEGNAVPDRPTASQALGRLTGMLAAGWIDDPLTTAQQDCSNTTPENWLEPGCCSLLQEIKQTSSCVYEGLFQGRYKDTGGHEHTVAIKLASHAHQTSDHDIIQNELNVFEKLGSGHPNIVRCFGGSVAGQPWESRNMEHMHLNGERHFLGLELLPKSLHELLYEDREFARACTYRMLIHIFIDIARGLSHMHAHRVVHYDLKPSKILIHENGDAKIGGFSLSEIKSGQVLKQGLAGTHEYRAPELVNSMYHNEKIVEPTELIDVFSFGRVMAECLTRQRPFKIERRAGEKELWLLIDQCCSEDVKLDDQNRVVRPSACELVVRLTNLLHKDWIDHLIPWVHEEHQRDVLESQLLVGQRCVCCCIEQLDKDCCTSSFKGLYVDKDARIHCVAVKLPNPEAGNAGLKAVKNELEVYEKLEPTCSSVVRCLGGRIGHVPWTMQHLDNIRMGNEQFFTVIELPPTSLQFRLNCPGHYGRSCTYRQMINVFINLANALHHLHQNHVVHCDLKPSNVAVDKEGNVKLAGFHASIIRQGRTLPWQLAGTMGYIAPELFFPQYRDRPLKISDSIDIFSLGVMMMVCLTRQHPHECQRAAWPGIWEKIDKCCGHLMSKNGNEKCIIATNDESVHRDLGRKVHDEWLDAFLPWPPEFWSLLEGHSGIVSSDRSVQRAELVTACLKELVKRKFHKSSFPWPPELCLLIAECTGFVVEDGQECVSRPTAREVGQRLVGMLKAPWIDRFLPWVGKAGQRRTLSNQLNPGWCCSYGPESLLGQGGYGSVYMGLYMDMQGAVHDVAIKLTNGPERKDVEVALANELKVLDRLGTGHPNIVKCFGGNIGNSDWRLKRMVEIRMDKHNHFLVLELLPGNLKQLLCGNGDFREACTYRRMIDLFLDMARGLQFLHENSIVHCDLNPQNVLIDKQGRAKLTDYGASRIRVKMSISRNRKGTMGYTAPELLQALHSAKSDVLRPTDGVDIYSLGMVMVECLIHAPPCRSNFGKEPQALWSLIKECCAEKVVDDRNVVVRPTAALVVEKLTAMQDESWVNDVVPWAR